MKVSIRDSEVFRDLDPDMIAVYLEYKGWNRLQSNSSLVTLWTKQQEDDSEELLLPTNKGVRDYSVRIAEILKALEADEQRSQIAILTDLQNANSDVLRIRVDSTKVLHDSLPISDGFSLIQGTRDLLGAAARSVVQPKPFFVGSKPAKVTDFLKNARFGQTERGSFIVTAIAPVWLHPVVPQQTSMLELPFERQVTQQLSLSLDYLDRTLNDLNQQKFELNETFLNQIIEHGISANLCASIIEIIHITNDTTDTEEESVEFGFQWSPVFTPPTAPSKITFDNLAVNPLQRLQEALEQIQPELTTIEGIVITLSRKEEGAGKVTIANLESGAPSIVTAALKREWYDLAIEAHKSRQRISITGTLFQKGNSYKIIEAQEFIVL